MWFNTSMGHIRPTIDDEHIKQIQGLIQENPSWHRSKLSQEICKLWGWQNAVGQLKDISCRDLLRELDKTGTICLPPALKTTRVPGKGSDKISHMLHNNEIIDAELKELIPLKIEVASSKAESDEFKSYIDQYHYLKYDRSIGENIKYFVKSRDGITVACLMFSSSAWKCRARDEYIGWNKEQRVSGLYFITNNSRNMNKNKIQTFQGNAA